MSSENLKDLPEPTARMLAEFLAQIRSAWGDTLRSAILFGSAAEGRLRASSDVNLLLILSSFDPAKADMIRGPYLAAQAAIRVTAMFLLESEVHPAMELFGQKFSDIVRRHRVLFGVDPFAGAIIPRAALLLRTRQVLLNLTLRLRETYIERGNTPERLGAIVAESAAPLRSCAATIRELEGLPVLPPKEALAQLAGELGGGEWSGALEHISEAREQKPLTPDVGEQTLMQLTELAMRMRARVELLR